MDLKRNSMNLFELHDYIEKLEARIEALEKIVLKKKEDVTSFKAKPPFYYHKRLKSNND